MSVARIPFTTEEESMISTLNGWMLFLAVVHFIGAAFFLLCGCTALIPAIGAIAASPLGGVAYTLQMFTLPILGALMLVEGVFALQARGALDAMIASDGADQQHLSTAFAKLKLFFMLELGWFAVSAVGAVFSLIATLVAPELTTTTPGFDPSQFGGAP